MAKHLKYLSAPFGSAIVGLPNRAGPQAIPSKYRQACFAHRRVNAVCAVRVFNPQWHHIRRVAVWGMAEKWFRTPQTTEAVDQRAVVGLPLPHDALQRQQAMQRDGDGGRALMCSAHVALLHHGGGGVVGVDRGLGLGGRVAW